MEGNNEAIFEQVKSFLAKKWDIKNLILTREISLLNDLGISGDDTSEIMYLFAKEFNIPFEEIDLRGFDVGTEPFDFITPISNFFKKTPQKPSLTLGDLEKMVVDRGTN